MTTQCFFCNSRIKFTFGILWGLLLDILKFFFWNCFEVIIFLLLTLSVPQVSESKKDGSLLQAVWFAFKYLSHQAFEITYEDNILFYLVHCSHKLTGIYLLRAYTLNLYVFLNEEIYFFIVCKNVLAFISLRQVFAFLQYFYKGFYFTHEGIMHASFLLNDTLKCFNVSTWQWSMFAPNPYC